MTVWERREQDSRDRQKPRRGKDRVPGRKRRALRLEEQGDRTRHERTEQGGEKGEREKADLQNQALPQLQNQVQTCSEGSWSHPLNPGPGHMADGR